MTDPMQTVCAICDAPLGTDAQSAYTPYLSHADKSVCVAIIRADERKRCECQMPCCDDYDPVPGLVARGVMSNEHDPDSCEADCCRERNLLADLRAKVERLDLAGTAAEIRGFHLAVNAVLALLEEKP